MTAMNPDASILRPPFDDAARAAVGLPPTWYDPRQWPQVEQQRLLQEKYLSGPCYVPLEDSGHGGLPPQALRRLRERMQHFCDAEAAAAG